MEICIYCKMPRADKIGCCGENHFDDVEADEILLDIPEFLRNKENLKREKLAELKE